MWLTAKNPPLWHFGYTYTCGGGMAHAWVGMVVLIIYKNSTIFTTNRFKSFIYKRKTYNNTIYITVCINGNCDILKFFLRV